jgi:hypothetical protein
VENIKRILFFIGIFIFFFVILFIPHPTKAISDTIQINEVYYNVAPEMGDDPDAEWVELYNQSANPINLKNWTLTDNSSKDKILAADDMFIPSHTFVLISRDNTIWLKWGIDINNSPNISFIELTGTNIYNLAKGGDRLVLKNDLSKVIDEASWGSDKTYFNISAVDIGHSLERKDLGLDTDTAADFTDRISPTPGREYIKQTYSNDLKISELVPQPADGTENEFIELYNSGDQKLDISNWKLVDKIGSTKTYAFPIGTFIEARSYLVLPRGSTGITLNDDGDGIILFDPDGEIKDERSYDKSIRGQSYALFPNGWSWTETLTPNAQNILTLTALLAETKEVGGEPADTISEAKNGENGEEVTVIGQVTTLPGEISSQYFFIQDESGGIQIYSYYKNFPELKRGNKIKVSGLLSDSNGTRRIKIPKFGTIEILESSAPPPPIEIAIAEIGENYESRYVKTRGKISYTSGSIFRITDGEREIQVEIKSGTGIKKPKMRKGDLVEIAGVLVQYKNSYRLLPFLPEDVKIIQSNSSLPEAGSSEFISLVISITIFALWNIFQTVKPKLIKLRQKSPRS